MWRLAASLSIFRTSQATSVYTRSLWGKGLAELLIDNIVYKNQENPTTGVGVSMADILVVEDEQLIAGLLKETLQIEGYQVVTALNGEDAVQFTLRETPHLIILDVMPGIDGYEVVRHLRIHPKTLHIPIIVLSSLAEPKDKVFAFEVGVDDYITKPFHTDELLARIRTQLRRVQQNFLSPLIGLPGGFQIELAINHKLNSAEPWSILYLDLNNFKAFNDVYGFLAGNELIRLVGRICQRVVRQYGDPDDFVGHVGGDDFIVVTTPEHAYVLCRYISEEYKKESSAFYRPEDLRRGSIAGVDRKGRAYQFPLISLSIGIVTNHMQRPHSIQEVSYLAAEAKYYAKQSTDNVYQMTSYPEKAGHDISSSVPRYVSSSGSPPTFAQIANEHAHHYNLFRQTEENLLEGYKQKYAEHGIL
jgi:DNA-binding response OmpR family regulator